MKFAISIMVFCISISAYSQDCQTLNQLITFHSIAFGKPIPDSIRKVAVFGYNGDRELFLDKDSLSFKEKTFRNLFRFGEQYEDFSKLELTTTSDRRLHTFYLWTTLTKYDTAEINNHKLPYRFLELLRRCESMFGSYTETKSENEDFGLWKTQSYFWKCSRMKLVLALTYGAKSDDLNHISLKLTDIQTEKLGKLSDLKQ